MPVTLVLADDHQIVRQGLKALLESEKDLQLIGEAADGQEAVRLVEKLQPDVLILDLMMRGLNGLEVIRQLTRRVRRTCIVVLSMHRDEAYVLEAMRSGAMAYVLKEASMDDLIRAIRAVVVGKRYFSPPLTEAALEAYARKAEGAAPDPIERLTAREREVLMMTVEGHSGIEISERLFISPRTVESHRANLMRKLGVRNQRELVRYAMERGVVPGVNLT
jgi:DNA-binding NarL/FixJ family response regulator